MKRPSRRPLRKRSTFRRRGRPGIYSPRAPYAVAPSQAMNFASPNWLLGFMNMLRRS